MKKLGALVEGRQVDLSEKDEEIRWLNAYIHYLPPGTEGKH